MHYSVYYSCCYWALFVLKKSGWKNSEYLGSSTNRWAKNCWSASIFTNALLFRYEIHECGQWASMKLDKFAFIEMTCVCMNAKLNKKVSGFGNSFFSEKRYQFRMTDKKCINLMLHKKPWIELIKGAHLTSQHKRTTRLIILSTATTEFSKTVSLQFKKRRRFFLPILLFMILRSIYHKFFIV